MLNLQHWGSGFSFSHSNRLPKLNATHSQQLLTPDKIASSYLLHKGLSSRWKLLGFHKQLTSKAGGLLCFMVFVRNCLSLRPSIRKTHKNQSAGNRVGTVSVSLGQAEMYKYKKTLINQRMYNPSTFLVEGVPAHVRAFGTG